MKVAAEFPRAQNTNVDFHVHKQTNKKSLIQLMLNTFALTAYVATANAFFFLLLFTYSKLDLKAHSIFIGLNISRGTCLQSIEIFSAIYCLASSYKFHGLKYSILCEFVKRNQGCRQGDISFSNSARQF